MAWSPIGGIAQQYSNLNNGLANDYWLKLYDAGTTNPYSMATDSTGATRLAKCKLSAEGYPITDEGDDTTVFVPHVDQNYRIVLYRNETDADANTTSNAAFNIDNLLPDSTIAADISQITTRGTTLQAQDDYDRSPLFVDGSDFTSGLGPHVITVPTQVPAWTPNAVGFRFYKLASSGAITTPVVTASDATTFTISDTLLTTDTLFVGDENFRNENSGDPEDIKARLSLSDALLASNNLSDVAAVSTARTNLDVYSKSESDTAISDSYGSLTSLWSGTSTSFDWDTISGGHPGDGLYVIRVGSSYFPIYVVEGSATTATTTAYYAGGSLNLGVLSYGATNVMVHNEIDSGGSTTLNFNEIFKVG